MIQFEDVKVISANAICMVILSMQNINSFLQSVLFIATIIYTIIRIVNEVKNGKVNKDDNTSGDKEVRNS
jgi:hypothetical protein